MTTKKEELKFMDGEYSMSKNTVKKYLHDSIHNMIYFYTLDNYKLPPMSIDEINICYEATEKLKIDLIEDIFSNNKIAIKFIKKLEGLVAYNGKNTFKVTCQDAGTLSLFNYSPEYRGNLSFNDKKNNLEMVKIFSPMLDKWASIYAVKISDALDLNNKKNNTEELDLLNKLAKKHRKKLI